MVDTLSLFLLLLGKRHFPWAKMLASTNRRDTLEESSRDVGEVVAAARTAGWETEGASSHCWEEAGRLWAPGEGWRGAAVEEEQMRIPLLRCHDCRLDSTPE